MNENYDDILNLLTNRYTMTTKNPNYDLMNEVNNLFEDANDRNICQKIGEAIDKLGLDFNTTLKYLERKLKKKCLLKEDTLIENYQINFDENGIVSNDYRVINGLIQIPIGQLKAKVGECKFYFMDMNSNVKLDSRKTLITKNRVTAMLDLYNFMGEYDKKFNFLTQIYRNIYNKNYDYKDNLDILEILLSNINTKEIDNETNINNDLIYDNNTFIYGEKGLDCLDEYICKYAKEQNFEAIIFTKSYFYEDVFYSECMFILDDNYIRDIPDDNIDTIGTTGTYQNVCSTDAPILCGTGTNWAGYCRKDENGCNERLDLVEANKTIKGRYLYRPYKAVSIPQKVGPTGYTGPETTGPSKAILMGPTGPATTTQPTGFTGPVIPTQPIEPTGPVIPTQPTGFTGPVITTQPISTTTPSTTTPSTTTPSTQPISTTTPSTQSTSTQPTSTTTPSTQPISTTTPAITQPLTTILQPTGPTITTKAIPTQIPKKFSCENLK
jgi:hypothetical protein